MSAAPVGTRPPVGVVGLIAIGIGGMVGGGIFSVLGLTVQVAGSGAYAAFALGGVVAGLTGWSYAVLSVRFRSRGGTATFLDSSFGTRVAGPLNLLLWLSYFVMLGLYAVAFGSYLAALLGLDAGGSWRRVFASAVVIAFTALNLGGAGLVARGETLLVGVKLAVLVLFCAIGLTAVDTDRIAPSTLPSIAVIAYAGALIFLAYEGFELIANASEDARDPSRSIPRAYAGAIGSVVVLYVVIALVAVGNLTPADIVRERDYALAVAAEPFLGRAGFTMIALAAVISTASAINATLYGAAKFTFLMARHGELPEHLAHPVWNRPAGGLLSTAAGTLLIVNLVDLEGISLMGSAGFLVVFAAVDVAAARLPAASRRSRVVGWLGAGACVACLGALLTYAATTLPGELAVLGLMVGTAVLGEGAVRRFRR
jgi:amino acid transporter